MPKFISIDKDTVQFSLEEHLALTQAKQLDILSRQVSKLTKQPHRRITPALATEGFLDTLFGKEKKKDEKKKTYEEQLVDLAEKLKEKQFKADKKDVHGCLAMFKNGQRLLKALTDLSNLIDVIPSLIQEDAKAYQALVTAADHFLTKHDLSALDNEVKKVHFARKVPNISGWRKSVTAEAISLVNSDQTLIVGTTYESNPVDHIDAMYIGFFNLCDFPAVSSLDWGIHPISSASGVFDMGGEADKIKNALLAIIDKLKKLDVLYNEACSHSYRIGNSLYAKWDKFNEQVESGDLPSDLKADLDENDDLHDLCDDATSGIYGLMELPAQHLFEVTLEVQVDVEHLIHAVLSF